MTCGVFLTWGSTCNCMFGVFFLPVKKSDVNKCYCKFNVPNCKGDLIKWNWWNFQKIVGHKQRIALHRESQKKFKIRKIPTTIRERRVCMSEKKQSHATHVATKTEQ